MEHQKNSTASSLEPPFGKVGPCGCPYCKESDLFTFWILIRNTGLFLPPEIFNLIVIISLSLRRVSITRPGVCYPTLNTMTEQESGGEIWPRIDWKRFGGQNSWPKEWRESRFKCFKSFEGVIVHSWWIGGRDLWESPGQGLEKFLLQVGRYFIPIYVDAVRFVYNAPKKEIVIKFK